MGFNTKTIASRDYTAALRGSANGSLTILLIEVSVSEGNVVLPD